MPTSVSRRAALPSLALVLLFVPYALSAQKPLPTRTPRVTNPGDPIVEPKTSPPSSAVATDPRGGRYRVVLNGVTVHRQTYDHPLQIDGKGDEVYFATYIASFDTSTADVVTHSVVTSKVHGDVNSFPERKQVGFLSGRGGIKSGDTYPYPAPFKRTGDPKTDELPMLLWQGELVQGRSAVVIVPTVWEWDDNPELFAYWVVGRGALIERLLEPDALLTIINNRSWLPADLGSPGLRIVTNGIGDARDRPIGLDAGQPATDGKFAQALTSDRAMVPIAPGDGISRAVLEILGGIDGNVASEYEPLFRRVLAGKRGTNPKGSVGGNRLQLPRPPAAVRAVGRLMQMAGPVARLVPGLGGMQNALTSAVRTYGPQELFFFEKAIVLSPTAIDEALRSTSTAGGRPRGVIDVPYIDTARLAGRYVLHLQIEPVP